MKTKNIYVIRHGETDWNKSHRFQGQTDVPLNENGQEQAKALVPILSHLQIEAIYSSSLSRAFKTAEIAAQDLKLTILKDDRLKETNIGVAEGLTFDEITTNYGEESLLKWRSYEERLLDFRFEKGESKRQLMHRGRTALLDIAQNSNRKNIAVFSHGMFMRALTFVFGSGVAWDQHAFSNGSVHHFLWSDDQPEYLIYKGKIN
ncbi:MAG: histidine phosphatase family protein [Pseudobdellovibrio sp.]